MKYAILPLACIFLFAQCKKEQDVQPTSYYDTLGIHWAAIERTHAVYYFQDFSVQSGYAGQYAEDHESAYETIDAVFNAKLPRKLHFFVWSDAAMAQQLLGYPLGFTDPYNCTCYVRPNQTLGHEMTHVLSYWAWGIQPTNETRFVNEGLAVAFDLNSGSRIDEAKQALAGQGIHSVTDLWSGSFTNASEQVFYPVAGAFMEYLYKQNMPAQFDSLIKKQTFQDAQNIYGTDKLNSLIANFNSMVGL